MAVNCILYQHRSPEDTPCSARQCSHCGWNEEEAERRKELPLRQDKHGLWYKNVTVTDEDADHL